ncbi:RDD family protein [Natronomonas marina]|jgi:uncharacterized RDD family membrane protein YckC|uniref:RDD family protein n=1 Tax=Natronomonas marina TaxID=2961939 RepID=UPI0020C9B355|nr:RDD family protein [Natronomonas marina]
MVTLERPTPDLGTERDVVGKRVLAFLIDAIGVGVVLSIVTNFAFLVSESLGFLLSGLGTVAFFAYFIYLEAEYGQTVGKMLMNIVVVTDDGEFISYRESAIRTLLRLVDALPFFYIVGLAAIYVTDRKQRVGDIVADTVVVKTKDKPDPL